MNQGDPAGERTLASLASIKTDQKATGQNGSSLPNDALVAGDMQTSPSQKAPSSLIGLGKESLPTKRDSLSSIDTSKANNEPKDDKESAKSPDEGDEDLARVPMTFPQRLFDMLTHEEHAEVIGWLPHGKGFIIRDRKRFENDVLPQFFKQSKYTSFTRKLNRWGFTRVSRGPEAGAYYHDCFQKGEIRLCIQMSCNQPHSINKRSARPNIYQAALDARLPMAGLGFPMGGSLGGGVDPLTAQLLLHQYQGQQQLASLSGMQPQPPVFQAPNPQPTALQAAYLSMLAMDASAQLMQGSQQQQQQQAYASQQQQQQDTQQHEESWRSTEGEEL